MGSVSVYRDVRGISTLDLFLDECGPGLRDRIVAHATANESGESILWLAIRGTWAIGAEPGPDDVDDVYAACVLYKRRTESKYGYGTGEFWYKDMSEHVGPCYYDVPNKVWDALTPLPADEPADSYRAEWRAKVAERKTTLAARPKPRPGDLIRFPDVTYGGFDDVLGFEYVEKSIFRPVYADGTHHTRVRLNGWTKQHYVLVEKEPVGA